MYNCVCRTVLGLSVGFFLEVSREEGTIWDDRIIVGMAYRLSPMYSLGKFNDMRGRV